jgi:hypothetical protein
MTSRVYQNFEVISISWGKRVSDEKLPLALKLLEELQTLSKTHQSQGDKPKV